MIPTEIRNIVRIAFLALVILAALLFLGYCHAKNARNTAQQNETKAEARTESAVIAITEIGALHERGEISDSQVKDAQNAIISAPVDQRDSVARYRLCLMQHRPDCDRLL